MDVIDWIDSEISGLQSKIDVLKMQRKVLLDAGKTKKLDELEAAAAPKESILEAQRRGIGAPRKPRALGVKNAVLETIGHWPTGIKTGDIIAANPTCEKGSIRQALNGLKKSGLIMQDGKMWLLGTLPGGDITNGNCAGEELTA